MSWTKTDEDSGNSLAFTCWRCKVCQRKQVTTGSEPRDPCACSTAPRRSMKTKGRR